MWKSVLAGTAALAICAGTFVYAQPRPDAAIGAQGWRPSAEDMGAFGDARIAALKAGLRLTAEQEKNWPALETALRQRAKIRADRFAARASADRASLEQRDPIERLQARADNMSKSAAALKSLADAAAPLYKSLDEGQKHRFMVLARLGGPRDGQWRHHHGPRGPEGHGPQHGPDRDGPMPIIPGAPPPLPPR